MKIKMFSVSLYDYLNQRCSEPKVKVVKSYVDDIKSKVQEYNKLYNVDLEYELVDISPELQEVVDNTVLHKLPAKYKNQIIADLVRYDYIYKNGGIYLDTDIELFSTEAIDYLVNLYDLSITFGHGFTAGEFNKGRIFACNWIIIDQKGSKMAKYLYDNLVKWATDHKDDIVDENFDHWQVWGYALYRDMPQKYYDLINPRLFQGYSWNKSWKTPDLDCSRLLGCHHFGFGEDAEKNNRPELGVFYEMNCTPEEHKHI